MSNAFTQIMPGSVAQALGNLPIILSRHAYALSEVQTSNSFGDFAVTYTGLRGALQIARDRGQFIVSGPPKAELESAGLWRAFAGAKDLETPLKAWLSTANEG